MKQSFSRKKNPTGLRAKEKIYCYKRSEKVVIVVLIEGNWADVSQPFSFFINFASMKELKITTIVGEYDYEELDDATRTLVDAAKKATETSYAPYSKFHVGAAILMEDGTVATGSNQENAAYPSGLCAERTAAFHASSARPGMPMKAIAIAAWTKLHRPGDLPYEEYFQDMPISPCGACRQALLEYEALHGPMKVILYGRRKSYIFPSVSSLLPFSFTKF